MLGLFQDVVIVLLVLVYLRGDVVEAESALLGTCQLHVGEYSGDAPVAVLKGVDTHHPQVGYGRADDGTDVLVLVKPVKESVHLFLHTFRCRGYVVDLFSAEHSRDNVLLVGAVLADFYL